MKIQLFFSGSYGIRKKTFFLLNPTILQCHAVFRSCACYVSGGMISVTCTFAITAYIPRASAWSKNKVCRI